MVLMLQRLLLTNRNITLGEILNIKNVEMWSMWNVELMQVDWYWCQYKTAKHSCKPVLIIWPNIRK